jgi:hypothetical protein
VVSFFNIYCVLPIIPIDKSNHIIYGLMIYTIVYFLSKMFKKRSVLISFLFVVMVGILKEVFDSQNASMHSVEMYDVVSTIIGGLLGVIISLI